MFWYSPSWGWARYAYYALHMLVKMMVYDALRKECGMYNSKWLHSFVSSLACLCCRCGLTILLCKSVFPFDSNSIFLVFLIQIKANPNFFIPFLILAGIGVVRYFITFIVDIWNGIKHDIDTSQLIFNACAGMYAAQTVRLFQCRSF